MPLTESEVKRLVAAVEALAINFGKAAGEELFAAFEMGLDDLPIKQILGAIRRAMRECDAMPTVRRIRELAGVLDDKDRAALAWEALHRTIKRIGGNGSVDFDDPVINATVRNLGGWEKVSAVETDQVVWLRKEFERVYQAKCRAGITTGEAAPLLGFHDAANAANGFAAHVKPPLRIESGLPPHAKPVLRLVDTGKRLGIEDRKEKP